MRNIILKVIRKHLNTFGFCLGKCVDIILISSQKSKENFLYLVDLCQWGKYSKTNFLISFSFIVVGKHLDHISTQKSREIIVLIIDFLLAEEEGNLISF